MLPAQPVRVGPDGSALVQGLPVGRCRLRVDATDLAPGFTPPFDFGGECRS